jgi:ABC-type branched-subunit amino acid transport system ATPase component
MDASACCFPNLGEMPQRLAARMSGGEQQMLTVAPH